MDKDSKPNTTAGDAAPGPQAAQVPKVRLRAGPNGPELPLMANFVALDATANTAYLNFGFVEPEVVARLQSAGAPAAADARIEGRIVTRIALPLDALALLHHQTGMYLQSLQDQVGNVLATLAKQAKPGEGEGAAAS
jgi:hypothetical protein